MLIIDLDFNPLIDVKIMFQLYVWKQMGIATNR